MDALKIISEGSIKAERPSSTSATPSGVDVRIKEGERERIQAFEGTVIAKKHGGVAETFTVRRIAYGVGIERVFPVNSPFVEKVTVVRKGQGPPCKAVLPARAAPAKLPRSRAISDFRAATAVFGEKGTCCPFFLYPRRGQGRSEQECGVQASMAKERTGNGPGTGYDRVV